MMEVYTLRQLHSMWELAILGMYNRRKAVIIKEAYELNIKKADIYRLTGYARTTVDRMLSEL